MKNSVTIEEIIKLIEDLEKEKAKASYLKPTPYVIGNKIPRQNCIALAAAERARSFYGYDVPLSISCPCPNCSTYC